MLFVNAALLSTALGVVFAFCQIWIVIVIRNKVDPQAATPDKFFQWCVKIGMGILPVALYVLLVAGIIFFLIVLYRYERVVGIVGFVCAAWGAVMGASHLDSWPSSLGFERCGFGKARTKAIALLYRTVDLLTRFENSLNRVCGHETTW